MLRRLGNAAFGPAPPAAEQGNPLELISYNADAKRFELGVEALTVLRKISTPVAVVAVSGRARQGKSFILNQLLGRSTGFVVGPSVRPCTKGLWMWSTPIKQLDADGKPYHLVLLDTEGIDAYDQTGQYSTQIFSLSVLLCSYFVYNQMGGIDEASLDRLSLVTEVTKHIRVRAAGSGPQELAAFTPTFLWLLRDFYLALEDDGRVMSSSEYLDMALRPVAASQPGSSAKNQIRSSITTLFPQRECFCLVRPVSDERQLQALDSVPASQLRPEFREGLERLTELIFKAAKPKRLGAELVTGIMLAGLATAYVDAINGGAVPTIATAWQGVSEAECRRAADDALAAYAGAFREGVSLEEGALESEHRAALEAGHAVYQCIAVGEQLVRDANYKRFTEAADVRYQGVRRRLLADAALACEQLIGGAAVRLIQMCRQKGTTLEGLQTALADFDSQYTASASGPSKWRCHAEFMRNTYAGCVRDLAQRSQQAAQQETAAAASRAQLAQAALMRAEAQLSQVQAAAAAAGARAEKAEQQAAAARHQTEAAQRERRLSVEQSTASLRAESAGQLQRMQAGHAAELAAVRSKAASSARQLSEAHSHLAGAQAQAAAFHQGETSARQHAAALSTRVRALEQSAAESERRLQAVTAERDVAAEAQLSAEARAASLQQQVQALMSGVGGPLKSARTGGAPLPVGSQPAEDVEMVKADEENGPPDPALMTVAELKAWLTDHGHEGAVWQLIQSKAKKSEFMKYMRSVM